MIEPGCTVYYQDPKQSWILGTVSDFDGKEFCSVEPKDRSDGAAPLSKLKVDTQVFVAREDILGEDVNDLLNLTVLHDSTLLNCLKRRYLRDVIYTNIGAIVVALNPFNFKIPWYQDEKMSDYLSEGDTIERNLPHSWAVAHNTYFEMKNNKQNQSVLFSGESGAGKTEATKIVQKYLAVASCRHGTEAQKEAGKAVGTRINMTSPALECFGNAKTVRNDNSSRFGKFMALKFDTNGFLTGTKITKYLLERSRVITSAQNERCYHALYLVTRGEAASFWDCASDSDFKTLVAGKCLHNKEFDTKEEFEDVSAAMQSVGISQNDVESMWKAIAALLHMGNISFKPEGEGSSIEDLTPVKKVVKLLEIDQEKFEKELITTTLSVAGQLITKVLNPTAAMDAKEALMKSMYDCEFQWLVDQCNAMLDVETTGNWIGLLDIFGFEDFEVNSFEQLCINLANEALQGHYNTYIFEKDLDECRAEGVDMTGVPFPDNSLCISLICGKTGVIALLDEECMLGKGTDVGFLSKISSNCGTNPFFSRTMLQKTSFTIKHYAGDVKYEVSSFLDKNRDTLKDAFKLIMRESSNTFVAQLLPAPVDDKKKITVGGFFRRQLGELMDVLNSTNPHWVRCIKPHPAKKPLQWSGISVMNQLSSSGVLGTVKIRKVGYPVRIKHPDFLGKYNIIEKTIPKIVEKVQLPSKECQIGTQRVFLKTEAYLTLEKAKKEALQGSARCVQAFAVALKSFSDINARVYSANKAVIEKLKKRALKMIEFQEQESKARCELEDRFLKTTEDLIDNCSITAAKMQEEWRRIQIERLREQYERQQKKERELEEKKRLEKLRREALEKKREERLVREKELRNLELEVQEGRRLREEEELQDALELKRLLEEQLSFQSRELFELRRRRREEDQRKQVSAKKRRESLQAKELERRRKRVEATQEQLIRGAFIKAKKTFEVTQRSEEARVKSDARRWAMANRIADEELHRHNLFEMQLALKEAKFAFNRSRRRQIETDNSVLLHVSQIEDIENAKDISLIRQTTIKKDAEKLLKIEEQNQQIQKVIARFKGQSEAVKVATTKLMEPSIESEKKGAHQLKRHAMHLAEVAKEVVDVGASAHSPKQYSTKIAYRSKNERPAPPHIDPELYTRLEGTKLNMLKKFAPNSVHVEPEHAAVPWKTA